jgi:acyl carrier protein
MSWTHETVVAEIRQVVVRHAAPCAELAEGAELGADLGLDSLAVMELVADVEDQFDLTIGDAELGAIATVGGMVAAIESRLRQQGRLARAEGSSA